MAHRNREMMERLAKKYGYKNAETVGVLLPGLGLKPPHTDEKKIGEAIERYQAGRKIKRGSKAGPSVVNGTATPVSLQNYRSKLVSDLAVKLFPGITKTCATTKIRRTLITAGLLPPWDDQDKIMEVLRAQGIVRTSSQAVVLSQSSSAINVPVRLRGSKTSVISEQGQAARDMAAYMVRIEECRYELEQFNKELIKAVKAGRVTDLGDTLLAAPLAGLAKLKGK